MSVIEIIVAIVCGAVILPLLWDLAILGISLGIHRKSDPIFKQWKHDLDKLNAGDPDFWDKARKLKAKNYPERTHAVLDEADRYIKTHGALLRFLW